MTDKKIFEGQPHIDVAITTEVNEERQTILHITCIEKEFGFLWIRIWPTTFLVQSNGEKKKLLFSFNIGKYPDYLTVNNGHVFTLVFEGLDKACEKFDLFEEIPEPGGFLIRNIERNKQDVYHLQVDE